MKLKLVAAISALAISALAHAQQSGAQPKPTKADAQNVVQIITSDKVKTQAYCELDKLEGQVKGAEQKNDTETLAALSNQAAALIDKLPEYYKLMDGLERIDPKSSEAKEFMSILSELDKSCTK
jgi:hypothetical protein